MCQTQVLSSSTIWYATDPYKLFSFYRLYKKVIFFPNVKFFFCLNVSEVLFFLNSQNMWFKQHIIYKRTYLKKFKILKTLFLNNFKQTATTYLKTIVSKLGHTIPLWLIQTFNMIKWVFCQHLEALGSKFNNEIDTNLFISGLYDDNNNKRKCNGRNTMTP